MAHPVQHPVKLRNCKLIDIWATGWPSLPPEEVATLKQLSQRKLGSGPPSSPGAGLDTTAWAWWMILIANSIFFMGLPDAWRRAHWNVFSDYWEMGLTSPSCKDWNVAYASRLSKQLLENRGVFFSAAPLSCVTFIRLLYFHTKILYIFFVPGALGASWNLLCTLP